MVSSFRVCVCAYVCALLCGMAVCRERHKDGDQLTAVWKSLNLSVQQAQSPSPSPVPSTPASTCPGCVSSRSHIESTLSDSEITSLRIEYIKQQILKKLRLKEPPSVKRSSATLPEPLEAVEKEGAKEDEEEAYDDFYGKTDQVILFPQEGSSLKCEDDLNSPSACVQFLLPADLHADEVTSAELWIYRTSYGDDFMISEMAHLRMKREAVLQDGWGKFDIVLEVKNWLEYNDLSHAIQIVCISCDKDSELQIALKEKHRPFLLITTDPLLKSKRLKRNMSCAPGITECCREELYISFADIGWDDWILQPNGYNAYFCRGSCTGPGSLVTSGSHYNSVIRKLLYEKKNQGQNLEKLVPCCTASRLSAVQLLYMDSNNTVTKKTLPNMVVDSCGCM
uniref:TGF-beta family profile domain-containing protein n=1 Tax=Clastoptera arizonana TaxID=38151 RepID=A0A1B6DX80_9HEMI